MKELIKWEMKKLCRRKITIAAVLISFLLTVLFFLLPFIQYVTWDVNVNQLYTAQAVSYRQERYAEISGALTGERIEKDIKEYQKMYSDPDNIITERGGETSFNDEIYFGYLAQRSSYFNKLGNTYEHNEMGYLNIPGVSDYAAAHFYETRNANVKAFIESSADFSDAEKEYWLTKNSEITEPYEYGYPMGWSTFGDTFQMLIVCIFGICIAAASVFAGEYQAGTDSVILSTKYGKSKLVLAKLISAYLFGSAVFAVNSAAALLLPLVTFGFQGGGLPLQIMDSFCPYSVTFSQAAFMLIGVSYLVMLAMLSVTLLCSAKMKSPFGVLAADVVIILLPVFFSAPSGGALRQIYYLLPYHFLGGISMFKLYLSYDLGFAVLDFFAFAAVFYIAVSLLSAVCAARGFRKRSA